MIEDPQGVEADRRRVELAALYAREVPRLTVLLWSQTRGTGLTAADIDDVIQEALLRALRHQTREGRSPDNPSAFLYRVTTNCLRNSLREARQQPRTRAEELHTVADPKALPPDEAAGEPDARERAERRVEELWQWTARFRTSLSAVEDLLTELDRLKAQFPPSDGDRAVPARRRRGRPTRAQKVHQTIQELPAQIALITDYFEELSLKDGC